MSNSTASWCPEGFVFPAHPNNSLVEWVANTSCAVGCISPLFSRSTWEAKQHDIVVACWIGLFAMVLLLATHLRQGKITHLIMCVLYYCFVLVISFIALSYYSIEDVFCYDNSIPMSMADGLTLCAYEGLMCIYTGIGLAYST